LLEILKEKFISHNVNIANIEKIFSGTIPIMECIFFETIIFRREQCIESERFIDMNYFIEK